MQRILYIALLLLVLTMGCGRRDRTADRLDAIDSLCGTDPRLAVAMLDSIDCGSLPEKDRHRLALLTVKSRDKAYIRHTSDSLILDAIDYYSAHPKEGLYPEALYYAGRVYSDLGDLPTALGYFQKALDLIPDSETQMEFKGRVLSQTGRLLSDIRLHRQALPYLEKSKDISRRLKDSLGIVYDDIQLISINLGIDSLEEAKKYLHEAIAFSSSIPDEDKAWLQAKRASILYREGKIDSALSVVRALPATVDSLCLNYTLSVATKIYLAAGLPDTAYLYAHRLARSKDINNRINGFHILFSEEIHSLIPDDSIQPLVYGFTSFMNDYLHRYEAEDAVLKNSRYNYDLHLRQRQKAEKDRIRIAWIATAVIALLIIVLLFYWIKNLKTEIKLRMALEVVDRIASGIKTYYIPHTDSGPLQLMETGDEKDKRAHGDFIPDLPEKTPGVEMADAIKGLLPGRSRQQILKQDLLGRLQAITDPTVELPSIDPVLLESKEMNCLRNAIDKGTSIAMKSGLWTDIEKAVHKSTPEFKDNLMKLSYGEMTNVEYQVALLSRFGIKPKDMAILLRRSRQAVSDRRSSLSLKIFEQPRMTDALDRLILRL